MTSGCTRSGQRTGFFARVTSGFDVKTAVPITHSSRRFDSERWSLRSCRRSKSAWLGRISPLASSQEPRILSQSASVS